MAHPLGVCMQLLVETQKYRTWFYIINWPPFYRLRAKVIECDPLIIITRRRLERIPQDARRQTDQFANIMNSLNLHCPRNYRDMS